MTDTAGGGDGAPPLGGGREWGPARAAKPQVAQLPAWERRFRAPTVSFPHWARHAPDRLAVASNQSGAWQVYAWDRTRGTRRQVTDNPIGVTGGACTPDGEGLVWFDDATGDEVGHWLVEPFTGGDRGPLLAGVPDAWSSGLAVGDSGLVVVGTAGADGFAVHVGDTNGSRVLYRHPELVEVAGLSRDETLLCLAHGEHGDAMHLAVRVVDPRTGATLADQWDGEGLGLSVAGWSPVAGDNRLALVHEREGVERPAVWDLGTGRRRDIAVGLPGDVNVADWWPDGSALLLVQHHEGRNRLHHYDLSTDAVVALDHPGGTVSGAAVRPDRDVWLRVGSGATPPTVMRAADGTEVCGAAGDRAPTSQPYRSWWFEGAAGQRVHGFVAEPPTPGPHPTLMLVHGGPTWAYSDAFMPDVGAWVDHGVAVAMVNYRGSTRLRHRLP